MNKSFNDMPYEDAAIQAQRDTYLYILLQMSKNKRDVLRTRLLWEEGLFCPACRKKVLNSRSEITSQQCKLCREQNINDII